MSCCCVHGCFPFVHRRHQDVKDLSFSLKPRKTCFHAVILNLSVSAFWKGAALIRATGSAALCLFGFFGGFFQTLRDLKKKQKKHLWKSINLHLFFIGDFLTAVRCFKSTFTKLGERSKHEVHIFTSELVWANISYCRFSAQYMHSNDSRACDDVSYLTWPPRSRLKLRNTLCVKSNLTCSMLHWSLREYCTSIWTQNRKWRGKEPHLRNDRKNFCTSKVRKRRPDLMKLTTKQRLHCYWFTTSFWQWKWLVAHPQFATSLCVLTWWFKVGRTLKI